MMNAVRFVLACFLLGVPIAPGQDRPKPVSLIQLVATPEKFDGKLVAVQGFLVIGEHPDFFGQQPVLYVQQEDAKNLLLGNSVWVVPNEQMGRDREKINLMYVSITGVFIAAHTGTSSYEGGTIKQIQGCTVWSNPSHPISDQSEGQKPNK